MFKAYFCERADSIYRVIMFDNINVASYFVCGLDCPAANFLPWNGGDIEEAVEISEEKILDELSESALELMYKHKNEADVSNEWYDVSVDMG